MTYLLYLMMECGVSFILDDDDGMSCGASQHGYGRQVLVAKSMPGNIYIFLVALLSCSACLSVSAMSMSVVVGWVGSCSFLMAAEGELIAKFFVCSFIIHVPIFFLIKLGAAGWVAKLSEKGSQLFNRFLASLLYISIGILLSKKGQYRNFIEALAAVFY